MKTKSVTVNDATYVIAPLNFDQYETAFFQEDGSAVERVKMGDIVRDSLENANADSNPPMAEVPAGDVLQLAPMILEFSGLSLLKQPGTPEGEATAAATA